MADLLLSTIVGEMQEVVSGAELRLYSRALPLGYGSRAQPHGHGTVSGPAARRFLHQLAYFSCIRSSTFPAFEFRYLLHWLLAHGLCRPWSA